MMGSITCAPSVSFVRAEAAYDDADSGASCMPVNASGALFSTKSVPDSDFLAFESTTLSTDAGRLKPATRLPEPEAIFPRYVEAEAASA